MDRRYKILISSQNIYKEVEFAPNDKEVKVGTGINCDIRLRKELFFEPIELKFLKDTDLTWSIICSDNLYLTVGDSRKLITKKLEHGDSFEIRYQNSGNSLFKVEFLIDFDNGKNKYNRIIDISTVETISIGKSSNNHISINSNFIQNDFIELKKNNDFLALKTIKTVYGVYHNGKKAEINEKIENGDIFSISDFFFYYKDNRLWTENRDDLVVNTLNYIDSLIPDSYPKFNRNTRIKNNIDDEAIEILDPPAKPQKPKNNIIIRLIPSLGMLITSGVTAFIGGSTMIIFSLLSGGMAIFTTIFTFLESKKEFKKEKKNRIEKYNKYISKKRKEIEQYRLKEKEELEEIYISQEKEEEEFKRFSSSLFDRTKNDNDFLCVNLGTGNVKAIKEIKYKKQEKLEIEDELGLLPEKLYEEYKYINDAPVICDLKQINALGIVGAEKNRFEIFKNFILDIISRQYFSDVKLVFVSEKENESKINWLRMLPHVWNEQNTLRTVVTDFESKNIVFEYLYKELTIREQSKKYDFNIIVFFYDEYGFKSHPISKFIGKSKELGVTFVFFGKSQDEIPLGCENIISLENDNTASLIFSENKSKSINFTYKSIDTENIKKIVSLMAPVYSEEISLEGSLTKNISLFEMLNIISVDDLNLEERWKNSKVYKSMAVPIGISKSGLVNLDLHDKFHGPHGLVAGTTGSGKSEILQTYILSISTLFHPYEVAFVIIDFKGGGMVNQFKNLPHLLGAITNIDGKEINRSLKSIKAELQKRQRLFSEAEVNHIDKYIKKFKAGEVSIPLPHLILIVDEFAELKAEQPEFMKELISAARIGRSLGVHLILATQKPSGQVNEQIWSNSRFKLCLKVQSQEDSNEVLKSPLAAEIKEPGRAYLQVGNNEIFELFQSAYSGAPERMDDNSIKEFSVNSLSICGKRSVVYSQKKQKKEGENRTQLDAIVDYVSEYFNTTGKEKLQNICLPPLTEYLTVPENFDDYTLTKLPLGIFDDPDSQYQGYAYFDFCNENTLIIGSAQTGKTNLLQDIIRLIASKYSPKEAVFYIADFGAMYLKNFETLNHVGGVVTVSENEKLKNLFKLLTSEIQIRKNKFLKCGLSSYSAYCEAGFNDLPQIFFFIDNFNAFKEIYGENYEDQFIYLTREGISCGISIVITNSATSGIGYRYLSNFANRIALKCNDSGEYSNIFDRCRIQPKDIPGRMLCKLNKELYEMQSFMAFKGEKEIERSNEVKKFIEEVNKKYTDSYARLIPSVPEVLTSEYIEKNYEIDTQISKYPIGINYNEVEVVYLDFKKMNEFCIIGKEPETRISVLNSIIKSISYNILTKPIKLYIFDNVERPLKSKSELTYVEKYTIDYSQISNVFNEILPEIDERYNLLMNGDIEQLNKKYQITIAINNKDVIEYISNNKELLEIYNKLTKQYKSLGISFIFSDIEDAVVSYSASELLKRLKENKKAIITTKNLSEYKFSDLSANAIRNNKTVNSGDVFLLEGSDVLRIKLIKDE